MSKRAGGGRARRMIGRWLCALALLAGTASTRGLCAQQPEPGRPVPAPADTTRPPLKEYGGIFMPDPGHVGWLLGIRAYGPMRHSGYVGLIKATRDRDRLSYTAEIEAGAGGVQIAAGRGATGFARMQVNVLRTWGDPMWVEPNQTFVGAEFRIGIFLGVGLVGYRRIQGHAPGDGWAGGITGLVGI